MGRGRKGYGEAIGLVDALLGKRRVELTAAERAAAAREFIAAGQAALLARYGSSVQAGAAMGEAKQLLARARRRMAATAVASATPPSPSREWQRLDRALRGARGRLRQMPNANGYALGYKLTDGVRTGVPSVVLLVEKKLSKQMLSRRKERPLPRFLTSGGGRVATDVLEIGRFEACSAPSDCVRARGEQEQATLGIFGIDKASGRPVALTAMHAVPGLDRYPAPGAPDVDFDSPCASQSYLGKLLRGTRNGIDAAVIALDAAQQPSSWIPDIGRVDSWRYLHPEHDIGTPAQMRGARTNAVTWGEITHTQAYLHEENLGPVILCAMRAEPGDSGAALVDRSNILLGLLAGGTYSTQVFSPIGLVFHQLSCKLFREGA